MTPRDPPKKGGVSLFCFAQFAIRADPTGPETWKAPILLKWPHAGRFPSAFNDISTVFLYMEAPTLVIHLPPTALLVVGDNERRNFPARRPTKFLTL